MLPDILKNTEVGRTISNSEESENDEELNKSINDFGKNKIVKPPTVKEKKSKKEIINEKRNKLSNLMKESVSSLNNLEIKKSKKSYNFVPRGNFGVGMKMISGFKQPYREDLHSSIQINSKQKEKMNKILNLKIENTKKRYTQPLENNIKTKIATNIESNKSLKGIEFNYTESEKSIQTIKLEQNIENEKNSSYPMTINSLPLSLKKKIIKRIKNTNKNKNNKEIISKKNINKYKIDHFSIEINNNNNITNDDSYNNKNNYNNLSNFNISNNIISTENDTNNNINNISNIKYKRSKSVQKNNNLIIKDKYMSPKYRQNIINSNSIRKMFKSHIYNKTEKQSAKQNLARLKLSSKNFDIKSPKTILSPSKKLSLTQHNLPKYDDSLNKNNILYNDNLSSTSADSFEIKRSYQNINKISGGSYIKDKKLQMKTIRYIKKYKNENQKVKLLKTLFTGNFDIMKNHKEEQNQFKKIENTIRAVKTKMSDIILKKKKDKQKEKNIKKNYFKNNHNMIKSNKSNSPKNKVKRKSDKKQLTLNFGGDMNNISLRLNSFSINPNETIGKLNISNDEIKLSNIS